MRSPSEKEGEGILGNPETFLDWQVLIRLSSAAALGALLGIGREIRGKTAGLLTHMLISLGAALLTVTAYLIVAEAGPDTNSDPLRVIQGLGQALGFLAAGAVIRAGAEPHGLTTAVNLWIAGAIGIFCGAGFYFVAAATTIVTLLVLEVLFWIEQWWIAPEDQADPTSPASRL